VIYLGINTTYNNSSSGQVYSGAELGNSGGESAGFYGLAGYLQVRPSDTFGIGMRGEYFSVFNDGLGSVVGLDDKGNGNVFAMTLSGNAKIGKNITLIPELRLDTMSNDLFVKRDLNPSKNLSSFMLAAVFAF
jgi:hypothetical protein